MGMNKKGFFTLLSVIILGYFLLSISIPTDYREVDRMNVIKLRVTTMNNFLKSVERDIERSMYISGFRAVIGANEYVVNTGRFLTNPEGAINELMMNGSLFGNASILLENQTIPFWLAKINDNADDLGLSLGITSEGITVSHSSPFMVQITGEFTIILNDTAKNAASFQIKKQINAQVGIKDFEDPLYVVKTNGKIRRTVVPTEFSSWGIANLIVHYDNGTYKASTTGPSFLKRLAGSVAADPNGIETLVDTNQLISNGIGVPQDPLSSVDYLYWVNNRADEICSITGITNAGNSFFRLDEDHVDNHYNVQAQEYNCQ